MLNKGEELFEFEGDFFKLSKKYFEMDKVGSNSLEMCREFDELNRKYRGINKFCDRYVDTKIEWFLKMITFKERLDEM